MGYHVRSTGKVAELTTELTRPRRVPFSLKVQAVVFVVAAAFAPMVLLIAVSSKFFEHGPRPLLPFEYWAFLTVAWVLGSALAIAHVLAKGLTEQIEPLAQTVDTLSRSVEVPVPAMAPTSGNELENLAARFNRVEAALADSRTAALGRISDLESANARLAASVDANVSFLSAVSHELRTPLSAIVSAARIIQHYHDKKPEVVGRFGDTIATEGRRLVRLVSDLLDLTRIEAKSFDWSADIVRPHELADQAVHKIEPMAAERGVTVEIDASESLPVLRGDEKRLVQVIEFLLENAVKFSPAHGKVELTAVEREGMLRVTVRDEGAGIPAKDCEQIFEKSFALSDKHAEHWGRHSTTLLGLPLCREIIRHHGGRIWASSCPSGGAMFCFEVPLLRGSAADLAAVKLAESETLRVLLVMQSGNLADAAHRALRLEEVDARLCSHFQEVLSMMREWVPDVLVVSSNCLWQLTEGIEARLRKTGVGHIMMFSPYEGLVDLNAATHSEPLLMRLAELTARGAEVLLVEDDEEYATVVDFELTQAGYRVTRARDGIEALKTAATRPPDAMVLDLVLPRLDGFGVLEALAAKNATIPTLVLTSLEDERLEERLHRLGAVGVYRKYELIQPRTSESAARVRRILTPVLGDAPATASGRVPQRVRNAS
jgi:signal transduction histidine kinase/DNA-binding response OmpR family regulator